MTCTQCRAMADSYLASELAVDLSHHVIAHLEGCDGCRAEFDARQALRHTLRGAFERSAMLAADDVFLASVRARLQREHQPAHRWWVPPTWLAIAAGIVLLVAAGWAALWVTRARQPTIEWARLALNAAGDHRVLRSPARPR